MVANQGMGKKLRNQVFHAEEGMMMDRMMHERVFWRHCKLLTK